MEKLKELLEYIVYELVGKENIIEIQINETDRKIIFEVKSEKDSIGKLIGKSGSTATAIRNIVQAAALNKNLNVDIHFS